MSTPNAHTSPRGRLAPSPTGALHLGNARSFLIAWLSIRSRGGTIVLRMEDLDHPKVKPAAACEALEDLRWLGIDWDEGSDTGGPCAPYTQSQRRDLYAAALSKLRALDRVYPCTCSRADVENAQSAPHPGDEHTSRYPGTCRGKYASWEAACTVLPEGRIPAWRFRVDPGESVFIDGFLGERRLDLAPSTGDFALARDRDGAGYTLAVVVDDAAMGVTEVLRGDDLVDATHCQLAVYKALGLPQPHFVHVPLVVSESGRRLAKRHGDTRIRTFRESGIPAARITGLLAWWCGWAEFGESITAVQLLGRFDLRTLRREPAVLDGKVKRFLGI